MTITQIQHLLAYLGMYLGTADGVWGELSAAACRTFQEKADIGVDGIPGKQTQEALKKAVAGEFPQIQGEDEAAFWAGIRYFTKAEFSCRCGCGYDAVDHRLVLVCEEIRRSASVPFILSSGCRCAAHNAKVGGVAASRHLYGQAVDFRLTGKSADETLALVKTHKQVAYCYKIDRDFVHMDIV